ncbi:MAG TPA: FAD-binding oxidoreductase [Acidimicrobiales bacterium]|nr:FAD-binding oxidoreductase [Acidimicrobiales bacterium]
MTGRDVPAELGADAAGRPSRFSGSTAAATPADELIRRLRDVCSSVESSDEARVRAGRDWWPLSVVWALEGTNPAIPTAVVRPADTTEVSAVLRACNDANVPVVPFAGRSGVCGGSIPVFGGISLDLTGLTGITDVDDTSLLVTAKAGTFGDEFEAQLRSNHEMTAGHWPQSIALSTVGGWVACRGAGQYSTRYGKIEDIVAGLEVVLAGGTVIHTGGKAPRAATGPDLTQLFVGSEGTLGVVTGVQLRVHPAPPAERRSVYGFPTFEEGLEACRLVMRRGATPAVLRLYDAAESRRNFEVDGEAVLVVIDEGDPALIDGVMKVVDEECARQGRTLDAGIAARWLEHRNELPSLDSLVRAGIIVETVEISGIWAALPGIYRAATEALRAIDGTITASAHQSHAYTDGACLYFTFAGRPESPTNGAGEAYYRKAFGAIMRATAERGGAISHHHGVGINRAGYMADHLGGGFDVLASIKSALDPNGILNPGKLGLPSPFGDIRKEWPEP